MRLHIVSDSRAFIDSGGELSLAHGIDYSTYAHLAPLHAQANVDPEDAVVVDLPSGTRDPKSYFEIMKCIFPKALIVWFVGALDFEPPIGIPAHWHVLEKPARIGQLPELLHLEQPYMRRTTAA